MADKIYKKTRDWCEAKIYDIFDTLDPTKTNSDFYKKIFSKMSNNQFYDYISKDFPYIFHMKPFDIEPDIDRCNKALQKLGVPLFEEIELNYLYKNKDGVPVSSKPCLVGPLHLKKVQQFITKKNSMSTDIQDRNMKNGLLGGHDKNGKTSDREMEALAAMGLYNTMKEFGTIRADAMKAKNKAYNIINNKGDLNLSEVEVDIDDSLSRRYMDVYLTGCLLKSNMITSDYYTYYTLQEKKRKTIERV